MTRYNFVLKLTECPFNRLYCMLDNSPEPALIKSATQAATTAASLAATGSPGLTTATMQDADPGCYTSAVGLGP